MYSYLSFSMNQVLLEGQDLTYNLNQVLPTQRFSNVN